MGKTSIEWTDMTWNPIVGCSIVSKGCTNCYAMRMAARLERMNPALEQYHGLTKVVNGNSVWTGKIGIAPDHVLLAPLRRKKPTRYFVNSMSDLFHEDVPEEVIDRVFAVMALCPQHTFQVLTKRPARMLESLSDDGRLHKIAVAGSLMIHDGLIDFKQKVSEGVWPMAQWPLRNVHLGVSVEDQTTANERIPLILATPAAVRFVSAEPLLGPVDFSGYLWGRASGNTCQDCPRDCDCECGAEPRHKLDGEPALSWIIVGGESGPNARPMHPDWVCSIRDQCAAAGKAFFFKQWGDWHPQGQREASGQINNIISAPQKFSPETTSWRIGKTRAGRLLDGVEHNAMPEGMR